MVSTQPGKGYYHAAPTILGLNMVVGTSPLIFYIILSASALEYVYVLGCVPRMTF